MTLLGGEIGKAQLLQVPWPKQEAHPSTPQFFTAHSHWTCLSPDVSYFPESPLNLMIHYKLCLSQVYGALPPDLPNAKNWY